MWRKPGNPEETYIGHRENVRHSDVHTEPGTLELSGYLYRKNNNNNNKVGDACFFRRHVIYLHKDLQYKSEVPIYQIAFTKRKTWSATTKLLMQRS